MSSRSASCHCGRLRITVHGEPAVVGVCHCLACQQRTGSVFAALASFRAPYGRRQCYRVRPSRRSCCEIQVPLLPTCGTTVYHTEEGEEGSVSVAVGAFADPSFPPPRYSIYDSRRHSWVQLPPDTTAFTKDPTSGGRAAYAKW
jgi:hypothetical protein